MEGDTSEIRLDNLSIGYRSKKGTKAVASGITATIRGGELTCLIGPNGAGKSTLLRTLAGFLPKAAGTASLRGRDIGSYKPRELARLVGIVLTEKPDTGCMTVGELVALGRSPYTGFWGSCSDADRRAAARAMADVGIAHLAGRRVATLSDGERQKAMVAKALAQQTPVILLDEPTAFLDFPSKVETMRLLRGIARHTGKVVFMSTHDLDLALQAADTLPRRNVVMVLMESMSASLMQRFGQSERLTPYLDSLYRESLSFANFYSAGNHTNHGLYATLYSFPSVMKRNAMKGSVIPTYSGLPTVLRDNGYDTMFFMTHESQYDNMNAFFRTNGYEEIYSQENYPADKVVNGFGVQDDYLFSYALPVLNRHAATGKPFFATLLTISNHPPYRAADCGVLRLVHPLFHGGRRARTVV